jgi:hypothetical protein
MTLPDWYPSARDTTPAVLTISEAAAIGDILRMAEQCSKVARLDDSLPVHVTYGTARMVGTATGCASPQGTDVRDMHLRVTTQHGLEVFWPVRDLIPQIIVNTFVTYDW